MTDLKKTELKACAHCKSSDLAVLIGDDKQYNVYCYGCGMRTSYCPTKEMAVRMWNRRPHPEAEVSEEEIAEAAKENAKKYDWERNAYAAFLDGIAWLRTRIVEGEKGTTR